MKRKFACEKNNMSITQYTKMLTCYFLSVTHKEVKIMAVTKQIETTSLSIEVQKGVDKAGVPIYTSKSFANVRTDVTAENAYAVAEAIKSVLSAKTRSYFLNEASALTQA